MSAAYKTMEDRVSVIQMISSLNPGGAERVALNLANVLAERGYSSHLCSTRGGNGLLPEVQPLVKLLLLRRTRRLDVGAVLRSVRYCRENRIAILHSHNTSLFMAAVINWLCPDTKLLWHIHGAKTTLDRPLWLYRIVGARLRGVIAVNTELADWATKHLRIPADRVWFVPNFVVEENDQSKIPQLPGKSGYRIVCVANLRPPKDHFNLLKAMQSIIQEVPEAHLILVGSSMEDDYACTVLQAATQNSLSGSVTWLGSRNDVRALLRACDIGVLSSASEGLPLALLEYGMAGLASVTTNVGQCKDVMANGEAGMLVPAEDSPALAQALVSLLKSADLRHELGVRLRDHVREQYGQEKVISRIEDIYSITLPSVP